jgi:FkbM family methyltransferase
MEDRDWFESKNIIVWGGGIAYQINKYWFNKNNIRISYICDNDKTKQGKYIDEIKIISPADLVNIANCFIFITIFRNAILRIIHKQLANLSIPAISLWKYVTLVNRNKLYSVMQILTDVHSKNTYVEIIKTRIAGTEYQDKITSRDKYFVFPPFGGAYHNEIFIDAGAFVGDTLELFLFNKEGIFNKYYCFEPSFQYYSALLNRVKRLKIEWALPEDKIFCINAGVGYQKNNPSCIALDSFFNNEQITFIKADIEGAEIDMLSGAQYSIINNKPKIAIAIYHRCTDLYEIPLLLNKFVPEYKFFIRHHSFTLEDTVLYCCYDNYGG